MRFLTAMRAPTLFALSLGLLATGVLSIHSNPAPLHAQAGGATVTYNTGWNMVALPSGTDVSQLQPPLYTMQPGDTDYESIDPSLGTTNGIGYWAYFFSPTTITLAPGSDSFYAVLPPPSAWVMVGNPSGTLPAVVAGSDVVWAYDPVNGYTNSVVLNPGQGAWVFSASGNVVTVTPTPNAAPAGSRPPAGRLYGSVSGSGAAAGTSITARASNGATCGTSSVGAAPATGSNYALDLTGSDPGCTTVGSSLTITVGSATAGSATVPDASGAVRVDLSTP
jgi:hypothetical protein